MSTVRSPSPEHPSRSVVKCSNDALPTGQVSLTDIEIVNSGMVKETRVPRESHRHSAKFFTLGFVPRRLDEKGNVLRTGDKKIVWLLFVKCLQYSDPGGQIRSRSCHASQLKSN